MERFVSGQFNDNSTATIGASYRQKVVVIEDAEQEKKSISLEIWDTAGQERFRSITSMYYKGAAGALVVYSVDDASSLEVAKNFVDELMKNAPQNIAILLVGNKCDLPTKSVAGSMVEQYAKSLNLSGAVECSALNGQGVDEAFAFLATQVHKAQQESKANAGAQNQPSLIIEGDGDQKKKGCC